MSGTMSRPAYSLYRSTLATRKDPQSRYARIIARGVIDEDALADLIAQSNSTVTRQEVIAVLGVMDEVIKTMLLYGYNVHTRLFKTSLSMRGTFDSAQDLFDPKRHSVDLRIKPSKNIRAFIKKNLKVEKHEAALPVPILNSVYDYYSDTTNTRLTPGNAAELSGNNLQPEDRTGREGVFLIHDESKAETRVERLISSAPGKIVFMVPEKLAGGRYRIEVRCNFGEIRSGVLDAVLTVDSRE